MTNVEGPMLEIERRLDELSAAIEKLSGALGPLKSMRKELADIRQLVTAPRAVPIDGGLILAKLAFDNVILAVEQEDRLIGPHIIMNGIYEKNLTAFMRTITPKISTFVDIGANIGYYTCIIAKQIRDRGRVFSFEPDPRNFSILKRNTEINWIDKENIRLEPVALSSKAGSMMLYRYMSKPGNTSLIRPDATSAMSGSALIEEIEVPVSTLDSYFADIPGTIDLIKIDVEGYEFPILQGGEETLRKSPYLHLVLEWDPARWSKIGVAAKQVADFLHDLCLRPHAIDRDGSLISLSTDALRDTRYANIIWKQPS